MDSGRPPAKDPVGDEGRGVLGVGVHDKVKSNCPASWTCTVLVIKSQQCKVAISIKKANALLVFVGSCERTYKVPHADVNCSKNLVAAECLVLPGSANAE